MKRALTGIAAAAVVLGTIAPVAFAATSASTLKAAGAKTIALDGQTLYAGVQTGTEVDNGQPTQYFPIWYLNQALNQAGYVNNYDSATKTWNITIPGVDATKVAAAVDGGLGTGNATISINGTAVKKVNAAWHADFAGGKNASVTTYLPIYYLGNVLKAAGFTNAWDGNTFGFKKVVAPVGAPSLSAISFQGTSLGNGTAASPAINTAGGAVTVSSTLTDANGNPIPNTNVTLTLTGSQPIVHANGAYPTVSPVTGASTPTWTVPVTTDANGVATADVTGVGSFTATFTAPYTVNSKALATSAAYFGFVGSNGVITPNSGYAANISSLSNATAGVVPVTVTLPLDSSSKPQSGVAVTFNLTNASGATGFLANVAGQQVGSTAYNVYTNAQGQATVYVNDYTVGTVNLTATYSGLATPLSTSISYSDPSAPTTTSSLSTIGVTPFTPNTGITYSNALTGLSTDNSVYVIPQTSTGELTGTTTSYNVSLTNGGTLTQVNGQALPSVVGTPSSATVTVTYGTGANPYTFAIDGVQLNNTGTTTAYASSTPYFSVGVSSTKNTTLTVSSGSAQATAAYNAAAAANSVKSFSPVSSSLPVLGQSQNVTYTVVDSNGNPVANAATTVAFDNTGNSHLFVTSVNGHALTGSFGTSTNEPTPIPLDGTPVSYSVSVPGVASWANAAQNFSVYTDANGNVTLTVQAGNVGYWNGTTVAYSGGDSSTAGNTYSTSVFTYNNAATLPSGHAPIYFGSSSTSYYGTTNGVQVGGLTW